MEEKAKKIIKGLKPERKAYNRTDYLLNLYKDLKNGSQIIDTPRAIIKIIDQAIDMLSDDNYIDLIKYIYFEGKTVEEISQITNLDERTIYRHKKRLVKRLSIILYGDEALKE